MSSKIKNLDPSFDEMVSEFKALDEKYGLLEFQSNSEAVDIGSSDEIYPHQDEIALDTKDDDDTEDELESTLDDEDDIPRSD